jgi:transposase
MIPSYYHAPDVTEGSDRMRGPDDQTSHMFSYLSPEERVRADHPLRAIRRLTDEVLTTLSPRFTKMYSDIGRPSIPPEQLLRALLVQSLYTVRSERLLMEEIDYSVLFRWFVGLGMDDPIWSPTTFSKNRDRLLESDIAGAFFDAVLAQARAAGLLSDEHFTVDGTLLEAGASLKSFRRQDEGPTARINPPRIRTPSSRARARAKRRSSPTPVMSCSTIGTGWSPMCVSRPPRAPPNERPRTCCSTPARRRAAPSAGTRALTSRAL